MKVHSIVKAACRRTYCALALAVAACGAALASDNAARYEILAGESELRIQVFRAGALARLGHNHVISTTDVSGTVFIGNSVADAEVEMTLPVASLVVDDPEVRADEGQAFAGDLSEKDVRETRENMLGPKLLDAEVHEEIRIVSAGISGELPEITIHALITISGAEHELALPATVELREDGLAASGMTEISHQELGLSPFTAAFGALRVADGMTFRYRIVARKCNDEADEPRATELGRLVDPARLEATLNGFVERGELVGVSALIYEKGSAARFGAYWMADWDTITARSRLRPAPAAGPPR